MDKFTDSLGDAIISERLDCNSSYWKVEIPEEDRDKTKFFRHHDLKRFILVPFGRKYAPATLQLSVDIFLPRVKWQYALVYPEGVITYSKASAEHIQHVKEVFNLGKASGVTLRLSSSFFDEKVSYLGHISLYGQIPVDKKSCNAIKKSLLPTNQT